MTVYLNARYLSQQMSGVQRYSHEIFCALDQILEQDERLQKTMGEVVALCPPDARSWEGWKYIKLRKIGNNSGHLWEQSTLYHASNNGVLVSLGNSGPLRHETHVLALHDAHIWQLPEGFSLKYRLLHQTIRPMLAKRAKMLITVSHYSAKALGHYLGIAPEKFTVIPNGCDHILRHPKKPEVLTHYKLKPKGYFLSVGNQSPNKNMKALIEAHQSLGDEVPPLAVVGGFAPGLNQQMGIPQKRLHFLGRVEDEALASLYEHAFGFVFPSLNEGFGIPPLEAMRLDTPVLAANRSALPETLGFAPLWFDPLEVENIRVALQRFMKLSSEQRSIMIDKGRRVSGAFEWQRSARSLLMQICQLKGENCKFLLAG